MAASKAELIELIELLLAAPPGPPLPTVVLDCVSRTRDGPVPGHRAEFGCVRPGVGDQSCGLPGPEAESWPRLEEPLVPIDVLVHAGSSRPEAKACPCCGAGSWWRLRPGGPWVCARCHPPLPPPEAIETFRPGLEAIGMDAVEDGYE